MDNNDKARDVLCYMAVNGVTWEAKGRLLAVLKGLVVPSDISQAWFDYVGYIPDMITHGGGDFRKQLNDGYAHGGGFHPLEGFTLGHDGSGWTLNYEGDPPMRELARTLRGDEQLSVFDYSWVAVIDGNSGVDAPKFVVARMD